jgi:hypothetical protein
VNLAHGVRRLRFADVLLLRLRPRRTLLLPLPFRHPRGPGHAGRGDLLPLELCGEGTVRRGRTRLTTSRLNSSGWFFRFATLDHLPWMTKHPASRRRNFGGAPTTSCGTQADVRWQFVVDQHKGPDRTGVRSTPRSGGLTPCRVHAPDTYRCVRTLAHGIASAQRTHRIPHSIRNTRQSRTEDTLSTPQF